MGAKNKIPVCMTLFFTFQNEVDNICSYINYLSKNKCQRLRMRAFQRSNFKQWRRIRRNSLAGRMFPDSRSLERYLATHPVPWSGLLRMLFGDFKIQILFVRTFIKVKKKTTLFKVRRGSRVMAYYEDFRVAKMRSWNPIRYRMNPVTALQGRYKWTSHYRSTIHVHVMKSV